jgi:hypothetical protein
MWPLSVFKHSPGDGFQIFTVVSELPLASSPWLDQASSHGPMKEHYSIAERRFRLFIMQHTPRAPTKSKLSEAG